MLYDPKWELPTVEKLYYWLKEQNPETRYRYTEPGDCLIARYYKAQGHKWICVGPRNVHLLTGGGIVSVDLPAQLNRIACDHRTYNGAFRHARRIVEGPWIVRAFRSLWR